MRTALFAVVLLCACDRGLADRQAETAAALRDEAALGAQLTALTRQLNDTKARSTTEENRAARSLSALREFQVRMVDSWKGNPATLAEWKKKAKTLPPVLEQALDLAQSNAGGEVVEKRFARAVEAGDPKDVPKMLEWWENNWVDAQLPDEPEEPPAKVCPTTRTLTCTPIDDDSLWCPDPDQNSAWAMLLENGQLTVARMPNGQSHTVESRLAPRVWLTRVGSGDRGFLILNAVRGNVFSQQWMTRLENEKSKGRPVESLKANFDADPFSEAIFWDDDELTWIDPTDRDSVTIEKNAQACETLSVIDSVPSPVRDRCRKLLAPAAVDGGVDAGP
ncbi:MAG: hypothetical protein QM817_36645 [Archangium sp.]